MTPIPADEADHKPHVSRITHHASRIPYPVSRIPLTADSSDGPPASIRNQHPLLVARTLGHVRRANHAPHRARFGIHRVAALGVHAHLADGRLEQRPARPPTSFAPCRAPAIVLRGLPRLA